MTNTKDFAPTELVDTYNFEDRRFELLYRTEGWGVSGWFRDGLLELLFEFLWRVADDKFMDGFFDFERHGKLY
jgi:hypothetical protein